jgi:hypothetical protein
MEPNHRHVVRLTLGAAHRRLSLLLGLFFATAAWGCTAGPGGAPGGQDAGSGSSGGSGGGSTISDQGTASCSAEATVTSLTAPFCSCSSTAGSGTPAYAGVACNAAPGTYSSLCCAADGYPNGGTCDCYVAGSWNCWNFPNGTDCGCSLSARPPGTAVATECNNSPGPDGLPWVCCADAISCSCQEHVSGCGPGQSVVTDCLAGAAALGVALPPAGCPSGTTLVSDCSTGPTQSGSSSGSSSGGSSSGGACIGVGGTCQSLSDTCCPYMGQDSFCVQHGTNDVIHCCYPGIPGSCSTSSSSSGGGSCTPSGSTCTTDSECCSGSCNTTQGSATYDTCD